VKLRDLLHQMSQIASTNGLSAPQIVGGAARDRYLDKLEEISDLDITTGDEGIEFLIREVGILLSKDYNFRVKKMPSGYTTLTLGNLKIDFSSHFVIPNIDDILGGMGIEAPSSMQRELYSRDFTCNTLLLGMDLKTIMDRTGKAIPDLKEKMIRTCLAPEITLTTNKNRVIRAIYLACKLDFTIDPAIVDYVRAHPDLVRFASDHTLREKIDKALGSDPEKAVHYLDVMKLWNFVPITDKLYPFYMQRAAK
jgi:poly(A) polymerase